MAREGPGRGRGQERIQEGSGPVRPIHLPAMVLGRGAGPSLEVGDINHREAPVRVASGTKGKQSSKGQDFSPQAPGALRPTPATPGGQRWERISGAQVWAAPFAWEKGPATDTWTVDG